MDIGSQSREELPAICAVSWSICKGQHLCVLSSGEANIIDLTPMFGWSHGQDSGVLEPGFLLIPRGTQTRPVANVQGRVAVV